MEFTTTDGKLLLEGTAIKQKRLTNARRRNIFLYCFFLLFLINVFVEKLGIAQETQKRTKWISVSIYGIALLLYLGVLFDFFFRQYLKDKVYINKIVKIRSFPSGEGLDTNVVLTMQSKKYKLYKFRTLEKQAEAFIETVRSINPTTQLVFE